MLTTALSEQVFKLGASSPAASALLFEQLAARRHEIADLMGHDSYAHYQLSDGMLAACPEAVTQFLDTLGEDLRPQVCLSHHWHFNAELDAQLIVRLGIS